MKYVVVVFLSNTEPELFGGKYEKQGFQKIGGSANIPSVNRVYVIC